jgi:hypothetical protein
MNEKEFELLQKLLQKLIDDLDMDNMIVLSSAIDLQEQLKGMY